MHGYLTPANLASSCTGEKPARLAVLGFPVAHSASPQLHQPALDAFGIAAAYVRLEVMPGAIREAFAMMRGLGFIGCNVTVPHKFEAMEACDEVCPQARLLGAVNTVVFKDGGTAGFNTDGPGFEQAVSEAFGFFPGEVHTLILGAGGGAGQAIATQCAIARPARLTLVNRSAGKIEALAERLRKISPETEIAAVPFSDPSLAGLCHAADLLVQTTSLGLKAGDAQVIPEEFLSPRHCAYDTIYQPPETPFLAAARRTGCRTANGLGLLIHQGDIAFRHWFPGTSPLPHMRAAMAGKP
ncbi:shikimate dehydrogenase [Akkermansiaceae bacterium]|nr:shikimate dehydrogenase [Akkermansiaceae bacterium]